MSTEDIKNEIREYIKTFIVKSDTIQLNNDTPLITGGIIDSISTLKMVDFLEKKYNIEFQPHDVDRENLDTIDLITRYVESKR